MLHQALAEENGNYTEFKRAGIFIMPEIIPLQKGFFEKYNKTKTVQQKIRHLVDDPSLIINEAMKEHASKFS